MNDNWSINALPILKEENYRWSDSWTSISDIGRVYHGKVFTFKEYKKTEQSYINFIADLFKYVHAHKVKIIQLSDCKFPVRAAYDKNGKLREWYDKLENNMSLSLEDLQYVVPLILREYMYGVLYHKMSKTYIHFGYDYYVYVNSPEFYFRKTENAVFNTDLDKLATQNNLYIEYDGIRVTHMMDGDEYEIYRSSVLNKINETDTSSMKCIEREDV